MMGISQRYTDADFHMLDVVALRRRISLSGAQICAPVLFQQYNSAVLGNIPLTNYYVTILIVQLAH